MPFDFFGTDINVDDGTLGSDGTGVGGTSSGSGGGGGFLDFLNSPTFRTLLGLGTTALGTGLAYSAAGNASDAQANAANNAAVLQANTANNALQFQRDVFNTSQQNQQPWLNVGRSGLANLANLLGILPPEVQANMASGTNPGAVVNSGGGGPQTYPLLGGGQELDPGKPQNFDAGRMQRRDGLVGPDMLQRNGAQPEHGMPTGVDANGDPLLGGVIPNSNGFPDGSPSLLQAGNLGNNASNTIYANGLPGNGGPAPMVQGAPANNGTVSLSSLVNPSLGASGSLLKPFGETFSAPTDVTEQNDPGYQFRLREGLKSLEHSAAAKGTLFSGGTAKGEQKYAQDYASGEYGNVYNRAFNEFQNRYNIYNNDQSNVYNRLSNAAGLGQVANTQLANSGNQAAGNIGQISSNSASQIGQNLNNIGTARGSGYNNQASAINSGLSNLQDIIAMLGRR